MKLMLALASMCSVAVTFPAAHAADTMAPAQPGMGLMGRPFTQTDGPALYEAICQACHMPNGSGATGAGSYPALAKNVRLAAKGYPVAVVLHGRKSMPAFGEMLSDEQIATVVAYVRTHFGNHYKDKVSVDDVKALRK